MSTLENELVWAAKSNQLPENSAVYIQRCTNRRYTSFPTIKALSNYLQQVPDMYRCFFEFSPKPFRRFFIDYESINVHTVNPLDKIIDNINSILDNFLDFEYDRSPLIYTSTRRRKISYHIVYPFVIHYLMAKDIIREIRKLEPNCDPTVYGERQHLRMYGCPKLDNVMTRTDSIKLLVGEKTVDWDQLQDSLVSHTKVFPIFQRVPVIQKRPYVPKVIRKGPDDGVWELLMIIDPAIPVNTPGEIVYKWWIIVGIVLYNHYEGSDYGLELWDDWSQRDEKKYDEGCCEYKWQTFGGKKTLTLGSLIYWVKIHNLDAYKKWKNRFTMPKRRYGMNNTPAVYSKVLDKWRGQTLQDVDLPEFYSDWNKVLFPMITNTGALVWTALGINGINIFGRYEKCVPKEITLVHNAVCTPIHKLLPINGFKLYQFPPVFRTDTENRIIEEDGFRYVNSFMGFVSKPHTEAVKREDVAIFLDHILYSFANGNEEYAEWITNWYAWIVQKKTKTKVALGLYSKKQQVVGKSIFNEGFAKNLLGEQYYYYTNSVDDYIHGKFNTDQLHKMFVIMDEATWGGDKKAASKLKARITQTMNNYEIKQGARFKTVECANYLINTNNLLSVNIEKGDKRYAFFHCSETWTTQQGGKQYMAKLEAAFNDPVAVSKLHRYLFDRDLSQVDLQDIPQTQFREDIMALAFSPIDQWKAYVLDEKPFDNYLKNTLNSAVWVPTHILFEHFITFCQRQNIQNNKWTTQNVFTIELKQFWSNDQGKKHEYYDNDQKKLRITTGFWIPQNKKDET